ncbi:hypothetical protein HNS38_06245 [Lentimicrobium sp. L6]|uniref:hypothetical protein n=1 Tax=Lentimicrobium sp. L6 TaxID=2735916 RepID=UPI0015539445|nr:hypothetical protein [Lentimicrobium sp. L6]NPD84348.1 hypothetical protein [Lentimicrobium sp. L6]
MQYNIYVGSAPGMGDVFCSQSIIDPKSENSGFHYMPKQGNIGMSLQYTISELADGIYHCSVQVMDQSGISSVFAEEEIFEVGCFTGIEKVDLLQICIQTLAPIGFISNPLVSLRI